MNYELAKKLKEAGFLMPDHEDSEYPGCSKCDFSHADFCAPALSELIEACGKRFFSLYLGVDGWGVDGWESEEPGADLMPELRGFSTPEIAVANLWLTLNRKP